MYYLYFPIFLSLLFYSIKYELKKSTKNFSFFIWIVIFIYGFTYQMGGDHVIYQRFFVKIIPNLNFSSILFEKIKMDNFEFEKLYIFLMWIAYNLGFSYELATGIIVSFCIYGCLKFLKKESNNCYFALNLLIAGYFFDYTIYPYIRQLIAVTIFLFSFKYIKKKNFFMYFLFILVAIQFHKSAYICFLIYFFRYFKINLKTVLLYMVFIFLLIYFLPLIIDNLPGVSYYSFYFKSILHTANRRINVGVLLLKSVTFILKISLVFLACDRNKKLDKTMRNMAIFYMIISYFQNILPLLYRVQGYFMFSYVITFSYIGKLYLRKYRYSKIVGKLFIILFSTVSAIAFYRNIYSIEINTFLFSKYKNYLIETLSGNITEPPDTRYDLFWKQKKILQDKKNREEILEIKKNREN